MYSPDDGAPVGERIKWQRERIGMSRLVLSGLVGRSAEWLKAVENGRIQTPRLPMLLRIARALELEDLAELTGNDHAVPVSVFAGERHSALNEAQAALTDFRLSPAERYVHARRGRYGEAWEHWERADRTARQLGPAYRHVQT